MRDIGLRKIIGLIKLFIALRLKLPNKNKERFHIGLSNKNCIAILEEITLFFFPSNNFTKKSPLLLKDTPSLPTASIRLGEEAHLSILLAGSLSFKGFKILLR